MALSIDMPSPIALFVYNRPEHTRRTLEALQKNAGADQSKLFIFSDGAKKGADEQERRRVQEVRRLIREKPWCRNAELFESPVNLGLAQSICQGVGRVLESYDRLIVLEDDLVTSPGFLTFMNHALKVYENDPSIFQVTGFMVPNKWIAPPTGFLRIISSWGWGTWRRAWQHFEPDAKVLLGKVQDKDKTGFDLGGVAHQFHDLERNAKGGMNTWAVKWYASVFLRDGLCLYPKRTMVRNIGLDGSGTNCGDGDNYRKWPNRLADRVVVKRIEIAENPVYLAAMQAHYRRLSKLWTNNDFRSKLIRKIRVATRISQSLKED